MKYLQFRNSALCFTRNFPHVFPEHRLIIRLISAVCIILLMVGLSSCSKSDGSAGQTAGETEERLAPGVARTEEATAPEDPQDDVGVIGLYIESSDADTYTLVPKWQNDWTAGSDIACFAVIPSNEPELSGGTYRQIWQGAAEKAGLSNIKISFKLTYTLTDGQSFDVAIDDYSDAEEMKPGYLEVYLYDDFAQEDGVWYTHLMADTTTEDTVISSFKLTCGANIDMVKSISLTAVLSGDKSGEYTTEILRK